MIGDAWDGQGAPPSTHPQEPPAPRRTLVVTGSRAEYGLLRPVMKAVQQRTDLQLLVIAAGSHLVLPATTFHEVKREFTVAEIVPMQHAGQTGRAEDVQSVSRGIARFGRAFEKLQPDWVVVLGDRIEAFAAATAAAIGGWPLAHIHGGDRAEGVADEAMRHAITKLAHIHFPATALSASRIVRMGEDQTRVHLAGSPAVDALHTIAPLTPDAYRELGEPTALFLMHPVGRTPEAEEAAATAALDALRAERVLALTPNLDPGRDGVLRALRHAGVHTLENLPREQFIALLKRLASLRPAPGVLVGNSSAGLIEGAALKLPVVDIGPRQNGRERCANAVHVDKELPEEVARAVAAARGVGPDSYTHPYGDGHAGERIAELLARTDPRAPGLTRKRCVY
ncbi:MAG: UDP-N-acetylglucosamine 2-epimerase [Phycisphaerales bacterium]